VEPVWNQSLGQQVRVTAAVTETTLKGFDSLPLTRSPVPPGGLLAEAQWRSRSRNLDLADPGAGGHHPLAIGMFACPPRSRAMVSSSGRSLLRVGSANQAWSTIVFNTVISSGKSHDATSQTMSSSTPR
jgi:hypothetical protein